MGTETKAKHRALIVRESSMVQLLDAIESGDIEAAASQCSGLIECAPMIGWSVRSCWAVSTAPDLLAALEKISDYGTLRDGKWCAEIARAAIAKARD
jgi:hypothetical protein